MAAGGGVELQSVADEVNVMFKVFDKNQNGKISREELKAVLQFLDKDTWTDRAVDALLRGSDANGDGELQFTEFWSWVCGHGKGKSDGGFREKLLSHAVAEEQAVQEVSAARREKWEAKQAQKQARAAEHARKEAERQAGTRLTRREFVNERVNIGLDKQVANELFKKADDDHDGDIDAEELGWLAASAASTVDQIKDLFRRHKDGAEEDAMRQVVETFSSWDVDGDGTISSEELARVIRTLNPDLGEKTVAMMMKEADASQDGEVDVLEFVSWLSGENPKKKKAKETQEALVAGALHRKRAEEARSLNLQGEFEEMQHAALGKWCKKRKMKVACGMYNPGPGASSRCAGCTLRHAWLCHGCGFVSHYDECVTGCTFGDYGWSCISSKCSKRCGCKKPREFWERKGFAMNLGALTKGVEGMLKAAAAG